MSLHLARHCPRITRATVAVVVALLMAVALLLAPAPARAEGPPAGAIPYDDGVLLVPDRDGYHQGHDDDRVEAQLIQFFTDCAPGDGGSCGGPPGRWHRSSSPVPFCTFQPNRPPGVSAQQFRDAVQAASEMWNAVEVAVGIDYRGDCATGLQWEHNNDRNELGWDDARLLISGSTAGVARGTWRNLPQFGVVTERRFTEFDVVFRRNLTVPDRCLRSIIAHELGHALGLGHSDDPNDLMYATFNPNDPNGCRVDASAAERVRLTELYGTNRAPAVAIDGPAGAAAGATVELTANATDPDGDSIAYEWAQVDGPAVSLTTQGHTATLVAPDRAGTTVRLRVTATDYFLHRSSADIAITVDVAAVPPPAAPTLESFLPGAGVGELEWEGVAGAANYRFCAESACSIVPTPHAAVTWPVVLGAVGTADGRRVLTSGARPTSLAACNSVGCSAAGEGPMAGGVVWPAWNIDFGYIGWAYDVPAAGIRFTIGGVVNQGGVARNFRIYAGSPSAPGARVLQNCGRVPAGGLCIGLLMPQHSGHGPLVTIVSELAGTPTVEQQIRIR